MVSIMRSLAKILEKDQKWVDNMKIIDATLNKILDFIVDTLGNDICHQVCIKQMKEEKGVQLLKQLRDADTLQFTIDEAISARASSIIDAYFNM